MGRIIRTTLLLAGFVMLIIGCERLQPPETPIPLSPDEIMIKEESPVVFFWQTSEEADYYALQVATDEMFENTVYIDSTITDTSLVVDAETFEKLTMYYWQVAASNRAGSSEWSKTNRFFYGTQDWLISPADSLIINTDAPTLVWHSYPQTTGYVVRICRNSFSTYNTIWEDTVSDTAYQLPYEFLLENHPSSYHWSVLFLGTSEDLFWAPSRCFFSRIMPDLNTTYFPFGLGYEWCYTRYSWRHVSEPGWDEWDRYDTVLVSVTDSSWLGDTLCFQLTGGIFGISNPAKIVQNMIVIFGESIKLIPDPVKKEVEAPWYWGEFEVSYSADTLHVSLWGPDPYDEGTETWGSTRLVGIGSIAQGRDYSGYSLGVYFSNGHSDRLLWFYNGTDTIYRAEDWGEVIEVDLDTTYFPMGEGYEWIYQRHSWGEKVSYPEYDTTTWDYYDTFTVSVADSFWQGKIMMINFADTGKPFHDIGNPARVMDGKVLLETWSEDAVTPWVNPYLPETNWPLGISYSGDTLKISYSDAAPGGDPYYSWYQEWTHRLRNIGPVLQGSSYYNYDSGEEESYTRDSLISFKTPQYQFRRWNWR